MGSESFLRWAEGREGRYELVGGDVRIMTEGSFAHAAISTPLAAAFLGALDPDQFDVASADFAVVIGEHVRYPDVLVDRIGARGRDLAATSPVLVVEVLSPSSAYIDLSEKAAEYQSAPSLLAYVVASQDEPRLWVRKPSDEGRPEAPEMIEESDAALRIEALGLEIPLGGIYRGIGR